MIRKEAIMNKRQIIILLKIGGIDVSNKCIDSVSVDRNFSDVGDKFSITLIDSPSTNILYDLELYMASGYRDIVLKYGDISKDELVSFKGTIWDYTNTFVGNIKKLTVTGIMSRFTNNTNGAANYTYNIDWNSYFNKRVNQSLNYGAIEALLVRSSLYDEYTSRIKENTKDYAMSSDILNATFKNAITKNADVLTIKGPGGSINLPIPECFNWTSTLPSNMEEWLKNPDKSYTELYNFIYDPQHNYWGELTVKAETSKPNAENISKYFSLYLATSLYVTRQAHTVNPVFTKYDNTKGFDSANNEITNITANLFSSLWGAYFEQNVNGIKTLSTYYVRHDIVDRFYSNVWQGLPNKKWYEQSVRSSFYGKINMYTSTHDGKKYPKFEEYKLDDENGGNYVGICTNSDNAVVAFYHRRGNTTYEPFVAVSQDDCSKYANTKADSIFNIEYTNPYWVTEYKYHSAKLYAPDKLNSLYLYEKKDLSKMRGFLFPDDGSSTGYTLYVQANPNAKNSVYGTAGFLKSGIGVNISDIVLKLATLEGWKTKREYITQTELVDNSDTFIMQNQTAMEFIIDNLVPKSITAIGNYKLTNGETRFISTPQAGFYPFFDKDGYFHYQPLTKDNLKLLDISNLGYNIPNSPVLSFQINTKGTAFYTYNNIQYNPINLVTGDLNTVDSTIDIVSSQTVDELAKTKGHNDTFDAWLGFTYNDVESMRTKTDTVDTLYNKMKAKANAALVNTPSTLLLGSGITDSASTSTKLKEAEKKIKETVIKATLSMWGNVKIAPANKIRLTNMIKGGTTGDKGYQSNYPVKHSSSGDYLILSMQDKIDSSGFIQNLNLIRFTEDINKNINKYNIDYTKSALWVGGTVSTINDLAADIVSEVLKNDK